MTDAYKPIQEQRDELYKKYIAKKAEFDLATDRYNSAKAGKK